MRDPIFDKFCGAEEGEVPLSLLDLIARDTLDLELAAWLVSCVAGGASWITGSGPGGIGKTTIMRSLLSFLPHNILCAEALPGQVSGIELPRKCVISHELSDHTPPTYLWDQDLRDYFNLGAAGHILVGNVHADDVTEIRKEIVNDCAVPEAQFRSVDLFAFVKMEGQDPEARRIKDKTSRRYFEKIFWSDGRTDHDLVFTSADGLTQGPHRNESAEAGHRAFLEKALQGSARTVPDLRTAFLAHN
jgi:hypothetical protein